MKSSLHSCPPRSDISSVGQQGDGIGAVGRKETRDRNSYLGIHAEPSEIGAWQGDLKLALALMATGVLPEMAYEEERRITEIARRAVRGDFSLREALRRATATRAIRAHGGGQ